MPALNHLLSAFLLAYLSITQAIASTVVIEVQDDRGHKVKLSQPAQRIVSLAPSTTELLFSAGAGKQVVGVVSYSNFPEEAQRITSVGSYNQVDLESVLALNPDLVVAWYSGNSPAAIEQLKRLGMPVYLTETRYLEQLPVTVRKLGLLTGHADSAEKIAEQLHQGLVTLKQQYSQQRPVRVFYQVWDEPLITINQENLISQVIELCGGQNVFADLNSIAPRISVEAVLQANPDVIIASGMEEQRPEWLDAWQYWPSLNAVKQQQLHFIPPDLIQRQTPRVLQGAILMCQQLAQTRQRLSKASNE
ncbi:iron complex transport system substrate-binding protein [Oceanospirillum multiglobuliferum]|uniref:Cobalamin-binding protein n=1 Tax=Oceanospirillum multiglobuliferum TaxID=64969 RepID=A0A1T4P3T2_9GAMM|nr:cobalamin-binding protein [Oceanospirillum multiglobuliferum]SJZ86270.1 iron complex transport system substrate-binding protein [Oceanospirillum multiglobuliferum]